jgi:hypothetical protein
VLPDVELCYGFPQYQGAPEGYEDREYDVLLPTVTVPAGQTLPNQIAPIENSDAPWVLMGLTYRFAGAGVQAITIVLRDWRMVAYVSTLSDLVDQSTWLEFVGSASSKQVAQSPPEFFWPKDGFIQVDLTNRDVANDADITLLFWGFKRYKLGEAPC